MPNASSRRRSWLAVIGLAALAVPALAQRTSVPTAFNYQGVLRDNGSPMNGAVDLRFTLYPTASDPTPVSSPIELTAVPVSDGLFTVELDFGLAALQEFSDWLEIEVASPSGSGFTTLSPRQHIGSSPNAVNSLPAMARDDGSVVINASSWTREVANVEPILFTVDPTPTVWQSFVPSSSGELASIVIWSDWTTGSPFVTAAVHAGEGTGGPVLAEFSGSALGLILMEFPRGSVLLTGHQYTIAFTVTGAGPSSGNRVSTTDIYLGGRSSLSPSKDLGFIVSIREPEPSVWVSNVGRLRATGLGLATDLNTARLAVDEPLGGYPSLNTYEELVGGGFKFYLGAFGSSTLDPAGLTLAQTSSGALVDRWNIRHEGSLSGSALVASYGTDNGIANHPVLAALTPAGHLGVGTTDPLTLTHVADNGLVVDPSVISGETSIISGTDAILGVVSRNIGAWGSAITLKDINSGGALIDTWSIIRGASPGSNLNFKYGALANGASNPTLMQLSAATGTLSIGNTNTGTGRLIVTQSADTSDGGVAIFDASNSQSLRLWVDPSDVRRIDGGASGTATIEINAGGGQVIIDNLVTPSTRNRKHDIETLAGALETLLKLRGVRYTRNLDNARDVGFIAEEMATVLPEVVAFDDEGHPVGIEYAKITALTVEAIKQQQAEIDTLRSLLAQTVERLERLESQDAAPDSDK